MAVEAAHADSSPLDYYTHLLLPSRDGCDMARLLAYVEGRVVFHHELRCAIQDDADPAPVLRELALHDARPQRLWGELPAAQCQRLVMAAVERLRHATRLSPLSECAVSLEQWVQYKGEWERDAFALRAGLSIRVPRAPPAAGDGFIGCAPTSYAVRADGTVARTPPSPPRAPRARVHALPRAPVNSPAVVPRPAKAARKATPAPAPPSPILPVADHDDEVGVDPTDAPGPRGVSESQAERGARKRSVGGTSRGWIAVVHLMLRDEITVEALREYAAAVLERFRVAAGLGRFRFASGQLEVAPETTRLHWQCACGFEQPVRGAHVVKIFAELCAHVAAGAPALKPHVEPMVGTPAQAREYALKPETRYVVEGAPLSFDHGGAIAAAILKAGSRTDLDYRGAAASYLAGGDAALAESHPALFVKHHEGIVALALASEPRVQLDLLAGKALHRWQAEAKLLLAHAADSRSVHFLIDPEGGAGKSSFSAQTYYDAPTSVVQLPWGAAQRDFVALFTRKTDAVCVNLPRGAPRDHGFARQWAALLADVEKLKDRVLFVSKYQSRMLLLERSPHVLIFTNELVDVSGLTKDRPIIWLLSAPPAAFAARVLGEPEPVPYPQIYVPFARRVFYGPSAGKVFAPGEEY